MLLRTKTRQKWVTPKLFISYTRNLYKLRHPNFYMLKARVFHRANSTVLGEASAENLLQRSAENACLLQEAAVHAVHWVDLQIMDVALPVLHGEGLLHHVVTCTYAGDIRRVDTLHPPTGEAQRVIPAHLGHPAELVQPLPAAVATEFLDGTPLDVLTPVIRAHRHAVGDLTHRVGIGDVDVLVLRPHLDVSKGAQRLPEGGADHTAHEWAASRGNQRLHAGGRVDDDTVKLVQHALSRVQPIADLANDERNQHPAQGRPDQPYLFVTVEVRQDLVDGVLHDPVRLEVLRAMLVVLDDFTLETQGLRVLASAQDSRQKVHYSVFTEHVPHQLSQEHWTYPGGSTVLHNHIIP